MHKNTRIKFVLAKWTPFVISGEILVFFCFSFFLQYLELNIYSQSLQKIHEEKEAACVILIPRTRYRIPRQNLAFSVHSPIIFHPSSHSLRIRT